MQGEQAQSARARRPAGTRNRGEGPVLLLALLLAALAATSCSRNIDLLPRRTDGGGGSPDTALPATCTGGGDPIRLPTAAGSSCAAALATRGHRFALCSCEDMSAPARVRTESFDSRDATPAFTESGASIGVGGTLTATAEVRAGGALHVAGAGGIDVSDQLRTAASLRAGGPVVIRDDNADIGTDAYVNGSVTATGSGRFRVAGVLHVPAGAALTGVEAASTVNEAVTVAPPCDCSAGFVDVGAAIAAAAGANSNAAISLSPTALANVTSPAAIDLPCGTFHLAEIDATAAVTLNVHGRALLAVGADVTVRGGLVVVLDPSAELDLLVGGQLIVTGGGTFGAPAAPARFRVWVAGPTTALFDGAPAVAAVVRAPSASVSAPGGLPLSGSLLARAVAIGADSTLRFDRAILAAGVACGEPAAPPVP